MLHFGDEAPSQNDIAFRLVDGLVANIWKDTRQEFSPFDSSPDLLDLTYIFANYSVSGFAVCIFRSKNFRKNYLLRFPKLNFGKNFWNIDLTELVYPQSMRDGEIELTVTADRDYFVAWDLTESDFKNLGVQARIMDSEVIKELNQSNLKIKSQILNKSLN